MLRAIDSDSVANISTYYFGPFVHEGPSGGLTSLKYILTPEGRILNKGTDTSPVWDWEYYLKDYLGNVRVVIAPTGEAGYSAVQQETHYYPYGMRMSQLSNSANSTNDWLFSSKQLESNFDLGWYDFFARPYMPDIIRTPTQDPHAENFYSLSAYSMFGDNPVINIDPTGMDWFVNSENVNVLYIKGVEELTEEHIERYGEGYKHFGADDMFGDNVKVDGEEGNILERNDFEFGPYGGEDFMASQGYGKGIVQDVNETIVESSFTDDAGDIANNKQETKTVTNKGITYATPNEMNKKSNVSENPANKPFLSVDAYFVSTKDYTVIVPYSPDLIGGRYGSSKIGNPGQKIVLGTYQSIVEKTIKKLFK